MQHIVFGGEEYGQAFPADPAKVVLLDIVISSLIL